MFSDIVIVCNNALGVGAEMDKQKSYEKKVKEERKKEMEIEVFEIPSVTVYMIDGFINIVHYFNCASLGVVLVMECICL